MVDITVFTLVYYHVITLPNQYFFTFYLKIVLFFVNIETPRFFQIKKGDLFGLLVNVCLLICHGTKLFQHLGKFGSHVLVCELAGTYFLVSAAVILKHKASYVDVTGLVDNAVAYCRGASHAAASAYDPSGYVLLGIHTVDHETVTGVDGLNTAKIGNDNLSFNSCVLGNHLLKVLGLLVVNFDSFDNVGHSEYFFGSLVFAGYHEFLHKLVV